MSDTPRSPKQSMPAPSAPPSHGPPPRPERRRRAVGWGTSDVLRAAALVTVFVLFLRLLWIANALFFAVFLGVLFGLAVSGAVDRLERVRIPRGVGAALVVIAFLALLTGFGAVMAPVIRSQAREVR